MLHVHSRTPTLALVAAGVFLSTAVVAEPRVSKQLLKAKEARLEEGVLPTWETVSERAARMRSMAGVFRIDEGSLPPPPESPYRAPAEFEPVGAFVVTFDGWGSASEMMYSMVHEGTKEGGAGAIVLTSGSISACESALESHGIDLSRVHVLAPTDGLDAKWARDFGPLSVYEDGVDGHLGVVDLHYYDGRPSDDAVTEYLADELGVARYGLEGTDQTPADEYRLYMEGGNYQTDGNGTCILSNDIPDDNSGNPDADTFDEVEAILATYLGCEQIIWLTPPPNTGTGHVDMYSKLLTPTDFLVIDMANDVGPNGTADAVVEANVDILEASTTLDGEQFNIHRVTIPPLGFWIYKTYTNSVIVNNIAMVPTYSQPDYDADALAVYQDILGPDYTVVGIESAAIVAQGGAVHCTTMQIASACGNGTLDELLLEQCDGSDLAGESCESLGYEPGDLACDLDCEFDISSCGGGSDSDSDADTDTDSGLDGSPETAGCGCVTAGSPIEASLLEVIASAIGS